MIRLFVFCALVSVLCPAAGFAGTSVSNHDIPPGKCLPDADLSVDTFPNLNLPAPAADDCTAAPLLCGNYLNGYASANADATPDSPGGNGCSVENNVWLRFSPCEPDIQLSVTTRNCQSGQGLEAALFAGDCGALSLQGACLSVGAEQTQTLQVNGLTPNETYWLMIDGAQGDVCEFQIEVLTGIGTGTIAGTSCSCVPGGVDGPLVVCPDDVVSYTFTPPVCVVNIDSITGGNGYICPTPANACPAPHDSVYLVWHIPPTMEFVGDSTGYTVVLTPIDSLINTLHDTLVLDSIWVEFITVSMPDSANLDSLAFCDCTGTPCGTVIVPLHIVIKYEIINEFVQIDCNNPVVTVGGQAYAAPGTYVIYQDHCTIHKLHVQADFSPPAYSYSESDNGDGTYTVTVFLPDPNSAVFGVPPFNQNGPGASSEPIPCGAPYTFTVVNLVNGCSEIFNGQYDCSGCVPPIISIPAPGPLNCCNVPVLSYNTSEPVLQTVWTGPNGQSSTQASITGSEPGLYTVTVTVAGGCTASGSATVVSNFAPPSVNVLSNASICSGQAATLNAGSGNQAYQWSNGGNSGSISVSPATTTTYTVTVTNPASCCTQSASATVNVQPSQETFLGTVGAITCDNPCVVYNGVTYCAPGSYVTVNACSFTYFSIGDDTDLPLTSGLLHECNPSNTAYTVSFLIAGTPPYFVNGTMLSGNYFTSAAIPSGSGYTFFVKSGPSGCETTVSGVYSCDFSCVQESGTMGTTPLEGCEGALLQTTYLGGAVFGNNDVAQFALHTNPALAPAGVLARNSTGQFGFIPGVMTLDQPYYVSHIVGPDLGNGDVDLNDPCVAISASQSILFHARPQAEIAGTNTLCAGEALSLNGTGDHDMGQWVLPDGSTVEVKSLYSGNAGTDQSGVYQYIVQNDAGCTDTASITVTVHALPEINLVVESTPCNASVGSASVAGAPAGLQYSLDGGVFQSNSGFKNLDFGLHSLKAQDVNGCESTWPFEIVAPQALSLDLGPDLEVTAGTPLTLQGLTNGLPVQTQWSTNAGETYAGGLSWSLRLSEERLITLEILDSSGCTARDEVWIRLPEGEPLYIPNVFSPQSIHGNTHFTVLCGEGYLNRVISLRVFDRWGEQVFERRNFEPNVAILGWDGTAHNKELPNDVFAFITEVELFTGEKKTITGNVTLLR